MEMDRYGNFAASAEHVPTERETYDALVAPYTAPKLSTIALNLPVEPTFDIKPFRDNPTVSNVPSSGSVILDHDALRRADEAIAKLLPLRRKVAHVADSFFESYCTSIKGL